MEQQTFNFNENENKGPVTVLGKTFANDDERREYFREELRKKLPELKKIEGYPIGEDDDIIELSDPPYYTACPNPWLNDFIAEWEEEKKILEKEGKRKKNFEVKEPYASDVSEGKNNPIYNAHSYHTKVPHPAIMRYILHYTQPGDIVYDGFCGTGMTGVAASMCGRPDFETKNKIETEFFKNKNSNIKWGNRNAIIGDLSPIASYIAFNYNSPFNSEKFNNKINNILSKIKAEYEWLYVTTHTDGSKAIINYVVWSDVFVCPNCGSEIIYWFEAYDAKNGCLKEKIKCPHCDGQFEKNKLDKCWYTELDLNTNITSKVVKSIPVIVNYTANDGKKYRKKPDNRDLEIINKISNLPISNWIPTDFLPSGDKMFDPKSKGIMRVNQFYNKRSLIIIAAIWAKLDYSNKIILTNCLSRNATVMNRFIVNKYNPNGRINGPFTGTLYCPSEIVEQNIFTLLEEKCKNISYFYYNPISLNSATNIPMKDSSIDYIFTDPPFGANIMYSELNYILESWLKLKTNNTTEAIENKSQNKSLFEYEKLMEKSFKEYFRILKSGKWLTVEFSNTKSSVWNTIRIALQRAGFIIANVSALDKIHGGIKAMAYDTTVKEDLIISCYKPSGKFIKDFYKQNSTTNIWNFVEEHLSYLPKINSLTTSWGIERTPKVLYDRLITYFIMHGMPIPIDAIDFHEGLKQRYIIEDGMVFSNSDYILYRKKKEEYRLPIQNKLFVDVIENENDAIRWLRIKLQDSPLNYQNIQPDYLKAYAIKRKGEVEVELKNILEENFIENDDHTWRTPNLEEQKDREALRKKSLLRVWNEYVESIEKNGKKIKDVRLEALRIGFKDCIDKKDYKKLVMVANKIPENILTEDEMLLNYYDIAEGKL